MTAWKNFGPSKIEYLDDKTIIIELNGKRGGDAIASIEDYEKLKNKSWCMHKHGYPKWQSWKQNHSMCMHQLVAGVFSKESGYVVDHINQDKLDNRKENLRVVTHGLNGFNSKRLNKYTGASKNKKGKWVAYIGGGKKRKVLGSFDSRDEALDVRKKAEIERYGFSGESI